MALAMVLKGCSNDPACASSPVETKTSSHTMGLQRFIIIRRMETCFAPSTRNAGCWDVKHISNDRSQLWAYGDVFCTEHQERRVLGCKTRL